MDSLGTRGQPGAAARATEGSVAARGEATARRDARPLYLMSPNGCVVEGDGEALAVRRKRQPEARYPLTRLSRIVSSAVVEWRPKALRACLERRIPVVLLDGRGTVVGYIQPVSAARSSLHSLLNDLLDRPDWPRHYENWRRAERMRAVRSWLQERQNAGKAVSERARDEVIRRYVYYTAPQRPEATVLSAIHQAALLALSCEMAQQAGVASAYAGVEGTSLHLTADLCDLLGIVLELELQGLGGQLETAPRESLRIFEAYSVGLEQRCRNILGRLHRRLSEQLREWQ